MEKHEIGNAFLPEHYEGFIYPRVGPSPYKVIDDPEIIKKKNEMRAAFREEFYRKYYNPYRRAAGLPGTCIDPAMVRYEVLQRTFAEYVRPGPKVTLASAVIFLIFPYVFYRYKYNHAITDYMNIRRGNVAYKDRTLKFMY